MKMALSEVQRQNYLAAMGIQTYFPRFILSGAKLSTLDTWPHKSKGEQRQPGEQEQEVFPAEALRIPGLELKTGEVQVDGKLTVSVLEKNPHTKAEVIVDTKLAVKSAEQGNNANAAAVAEVRFQLVFIRINADICVLNQAPYLGVNQVLSVSHKHLLSNILSALKIDSTSIRVDEVAPFRWPFSDHLENTEAAAQAALRGYLEHQGSIKGFSTLLVMGDVAERYAAPVALKSNQGWKIVKTRSLDEILNRWQLKSDVWQQLQGLNQHLS